jgi:hypothetical protein
MEEKEGWRKEEGRRQRKNRTFTRAWIIQLHGRAHVTFP